MAHVADWQEYTDKSIDAKGRECVRTGYRPVVAVDFSCTLTADMTSVPPRPIQPGDVLTLIRMLQSRHFSIAVVSCDWYGLPYFEEPLTQLGIHVERLTTDLASKGEAVYQTLADSMYDGRLSGPHDPILARELRALTRTDTGKIDHPPGGSKDVADAVACAVWGAIVLGGAEGERAAGQDDVVPDYAPEPIGGWPHGLNESIGLPVGMVEHFGAPTRLSPYGGQRPHH